MEKNVKEILKPYRVETMLSAFEETRPGQSVEYLPPLINSNRVEWTDGYGTVEGEIGITDPSYKNQRIIQRMRRYHFEIIKEKRKEVVIKKIDVTIRIYTSIDNSTEHISISPSLQNSDGKYWYMSFDFKYDAKSPMRRYDESDDTKYIESNYWVRGDIGSNPFRNQPIIAEVYAKARTIATDLCNPKKRYDTSELIDLLKSLDSEEINHSLLSWNYIVRQQEEYNVKIKK